MSMTREEIDAKHRAIEARIEASEARLSSSLADIRADLRSTTSEIAASIRVLDGEIAASIRVLDGKIAGLPSRWTLFSTVFTGVLTIVAGILAAMALAGDRFDTGLDLGGQMFETKQTVDQLSADNNRRAQQIDLLAMNVQALVDALSKAGRLPPPTPDP